MLAENERAHRAAGKPLQDGQRTVLVKWGDLIGFFTALVPRLNAAEAERTRKIFLGVPGLGEAKSELTRALPPELSWQGKPSKNAHERMTGQLLGWRALGREVFSPQERAVSGLFFEALNLNNTQGTWTVSYAVMRARVAEEFGSRPRAFLRSAKVLRVGAVTDELDLSPLETVATRDRRRITSLAFKKSGAEP